jgi:biopolymer transport protein ExbD
MWKIRHQGSPEAREGLTFAQVLEGLLNGQWEPTDEVMGPEDTAWVAIENHPDLAEIAADIEPVPHRGYDDETRLDMTPLIDVCLVLLIFFILTTTFGLWVQKVIDTANLTSDEQSGALQITEEQVEASMIRVVVREEGSTPVFEVEDQRVDRDSLVPVLRTFTSGGRKTDVLIEASGNVPRESVITVQDAAKGAGVQRVFRLVRSHGPPPSGE